MDPINQYIDRCIIDAYATKDLFNGYSLDITSKKISDDERTSLLDFLFDYDPILKEAALDRMQELIDQRLEACELNDREDSGLKLIQLPNGDKEFKYSGCL